MPSKKLTTVDAEPTRTDDGAIQVEVTLPVRPRRHESRKGGQPYSVSDAGSRSRIPRITRLMALASSSRRWSTMEKSATTPISRGWATSHGHGSLRS